MKNNIIENILIKNILPTLLLSSVITTNIIAMDGGDRPNRQTNQQPSQIENNPQQEPR